MVPTTRRLWPVLAMLLLAIPAFAQDSLQFTNTNADVLSVLAAEGIVGGEQVDALGRSIGDLTVDGPLAATYATSDTDPRATVELDGGQDLFRFNGATSCAGLVEVSFLDRVGAPLDVLDARLVAARADDQGGYLVQAVSTVAETTRSEILAVDGGGTYWFEAHFALGADERGRAATFTRTLEVTVGCDQIVAVDVAVGDASATRGASDIGPAPASVLVPARGNGRALLDTTVRVPGPAGVKSRGAARRSFTKSVDGETQNCTTDTFDGPDLDTIWDFAFLGDADQGSASVVGGQLQVEGDGSSLFHGTDNGAFVYQEVGGNFRAEIDLVDVPVNQGGDFRKGGLMVRESTDTNAPRVMVQLVVDHPVYLTTALQFDFRNKAGDALELASTPVDVGLPLRIAVDRKGDVFTAYYSTDGGQSWIKPLGGFGQGSIEIAMGESALVGTTATSYDTENTLTVAFDDFELCKPNTDALPTPPDALSCQAGRKLDVTYLVDSSGSMIAGFPGAASKLDAVATAIADTNAALAANFPGSRSALVSYRTPRISTPANNVAIGAIVQSPLTTDLAAVTAAAQALQTVPINEDDNTPAPLGLSKTTEMLVATHDTDFLPVVVWLTDGAPNIDFAGRGPLEYRFPEILPLSIRDGVGNFLPWGDVAWLGNFNGGIGTYDGEVFANTLFQIERLKDTVADSLIIPVAIQGEDTYYEDLLAYAAEYSSTTLYTPADTASLAAAFADILATLDCGATIGDRVWHDTNGDGVQDAGEVGLEGVTVELVDAGGVVVATLVTGTDGIYLFEDVIPGTYSVRVDASTLPAGLDLPTYDLDGTATANVASVTVAEDEVRLDVDFGYQESVVCEDGNYRDDFATKSYSNQDGSLDWAGDWIENDPNGGGPASGQVAIHNGLLTLDDAPDTGAQPSAERSVDLSAGGHATLAFEFVTSSGVDASDAITVEVSADGGATWTTLEVITGITGSVRADRSYDISAFAAEDTRVRFRVSNKYGGHGELFCIDWVEIVRDCSLCRDTTVRDDFRHRSYGNDDGPQSWSGAWIEDDSAGVGPRAGAVQVDRHDDLLTMNLAAKAHAPSIAREANLGGAQVAELSLRFVTASGTDASDVFFVEISSDGGATFTVLDTVTGISGYHAETRSYDVSAFASDRTVVRLRIADGSYQGHNEGVCFDWVELAGWCDATSAVGSIAGRVWNDANGNGVQEDPSSGLADVKVKLEQDGSVIANTRTDAHGDYSFDGLEAGDYVVRVATATLPVDEATYDADGIDTANQVTVDLGPGEDRDDVRFGYREASSSGGAPCGGCNHRSGSLNGSGHYQIQPDGSHFWSDGGVEAWLQADGVDFDLYLYRWNGRKWKLVSRSDASGTDEHIAYNGRRGYYTFKVRSWSGAGGYDLWYDHP
ncbi:MAG: SdrD B-like domain-containing protein [Acidobacteriota bacterium]